jgi:SAM-dependent methyltransferase
LQALVCGGSIGCEAYSLLVAVREFGAANHQFDVLSIDISDAVTEQGRAACFPAATFAPLFDMEGGMPETMRARWFNRAEEAASWFPKPELRAAVEFETLDLLAQPLERQFDLVVCQNVLTHLEPPSATLLLDRLLARAKHRAVFVCSGLDLELKTRIAAAGFAPWMGRLDEIHEAFASHRMHYRVNRGRHYFELEDIDRGRQDWPVRYSTLFYRL